MSHIKLLTRLSIILVMAQSSLCTWKPNNSEKEVLCQTTECQARGEEYKNNMDTHINPCQDFYTFTCGNWQNNHPDPKYAEEWNVIDVMHLDFLRIIRETVESYNSHPDDNILFRKAKEVYETCVKIPEYPKKEAEDIAEEIATIGRVPNTLWNIHLKYLKLSGESAFFRVKVLANIPSESIPMLMLMEPSSAYGSIFHEKTWKLQEKQAYTYFLFLIMKSLKLTDSDSVIKEKTAKVFEFRKKLDRIIEQNLRKEPDSFNPLTEQELGIWFLGANQTQRKNADMHWTQIVEILLQNLSWQMRQTKKVVAVRKRKYFLDLMDLFQNVPEEVLVYHMEVYFVERHLKLKENLFKLLEATSVEPHGLFRYIREGSKKRWQMCIQNHNMLSTLENLLFFKWFSKENADTVHHIISRLKISIEKQMTNSKWLDPPTREKTIEKLNQLEEWIGFPPWIKRIGVPREHLRPNKKEILTPNAVLNIKHKFLYIHAPLLLPPVFSPTIPAVYNYAGIGTSLGHELYHVMDDCGSYLEGEWSNDWWPPKIRAQCLKRMNSFVRTFDKITDREFKNRYNVDVQSDTTSSLSENFPDVMGLEAAYNAYKELSNTQISVCQTLPHFENYSCDQMFFIAFAQTFCGHNTKKVALNKLEISDHSIDSVRINGAVSQMKSFGTVFGCPVETPMHPQRKLSLW